MKKIIKIDDIEGKVYELDNWKLDQSPQLKRYFNAKFDELKKNYDKLIQDFNWNKIIYDSEILFKPVIGQEYYLYQKKNGKRFMSLINPQDWTQNKDLNYIGCFKQDSRQKWNLIELNN